MNKMQHKVVSNKILILIALHIIFIFLQLFLVIPQCILFFLSPAFFIMEALLIFSTLWRTKDKPMEHRNTVSFILLGFALIAALYGQMELGALEKYSEFHNGENVFEFYANVTYISLILFLILFKPHSEKKVCLSKICTGIILLSLFVATVHIDILYVLDQTEKISPSTIGYTPFSHVVWMIFLTIILAIFDNCEPLE